LIFLYKNHAKNFDKSRESLPDIKIN